MLFHSGQGAGQFGNSPPIVQYLNSYTQTTSTTISTGTPSATRSIVVIITGYNASSTGGVSNLLINGNSCVRVSSSHVSSYVGFVAIGALALPTGTTASLSFTASFTGLNIAVFSIKNIIPTNFGAATNSGTPTGTSFSHTLTTTPPIKKSLIFTGISSYAGGTTNATSSLPNTLIANYGGYVLGSAYTSFSTAVNPYTIKWTAPSGADWSSLGHTVSSLAIGF